MSIRNAFANRRGFLRRLTTALAGTSVASTGVALAGGNSGSEPRDNPSRILTLDDESRPWSPRGGDPFLGEILMVGFTFAPRGWALCNGQLLQISQNDALFSLLGTIYGGDGRTTFGLPDLRGRVPVHQGQGIGLSNQRIGFKSGEETHVLTSNEMPSHNHPITDVNGVLVRGTGTQFRGLAKGSDEGSFPVSGATANQGGSQAHNIMQPYQVINFVIATVGIYPSRN